MDASGQIPIAAYDGARVRPNGATHRAAGHWPYASDGRHRTPDQMSHAARCGCVTAPPAGSGRTRCRRRRGVGGGQRQGRLCGRQPGAPWPWRLRAVFRVA